MLEDGVPCHPRFLQAIADNLHLAYGCLAARFATWTDETTIFLDCLEATKTEIVRLQKHPELFSSRLIEADFWRKIFQICDTVLGKAIPLLEGIDEVDRNILAIDVVHELDRTMPGRDEKRKPWEQLIHNRALGSGVDLLEMGDVGSSQLMPMASIRIIMKLLEEARVLASDIVDVSMFN